MDFAIRATSPRQRFSTLSAGNQQKAVIARWLRRDPAVLLLDEPTAGIDVATRLDLHTRVAAAAEHGCAVVVASDDLEELAAICSRVLVLQRGRIVRELQRPGLDAEQLARAVFGTVEPAS